MTPRSLPDQTPGDRYSTTVSNWERELSDAAAAQRAALAAAEAGGNLTDKRRTDIAEDAIYAVWGACSRFLEDIARGPYVPAKRPQRRRGKAS